MECKIVYEKFDTIIHKPIECMTCGHSFCSKCVIQLKDCSICRRQIKEKSTNFSLMEILEQSESGRQSSRAIATSKNKNETSRVITILQYFLDTVTGLVKFHYFQLMFSVSLQLVENNYIPKVRLYKTRFITAKQIIEVN